MVSFFFLGIPLLSTYHDERARDVDSVEQELPVGTQLPALDTLDRDVLLPSNWLESPLHVGLEALGDDMEAHSNDAEETKGQNLHRDTCKGDILALVHLVEVVGIGNRGTGNHDGTDQLEEKGGDVEGYEDGGHPAG